MTLFSEEAYRAAAARLAVDVPAIKAVADVESNGVTHWPSGRGPILFEAHWFGRLTGYRFNDSHPGISTRAWDRTLYQGGEAEYARLEEAAALDRKAALQSASWGAFQIMGFHYATLGFASPQAFVDRMQTADGQLDIFVAFIKASPAIEDALRRHDWHNFAAFYNGPGQVPIYEKKLRDSFYAHADASDPAPLPTATLFRGCKGADVAEIQRTLGVAVTGDFDAATDAAVRAFQAAHGLDVDGIVGRNTRAILYSA
jgi:hypothetical protein